MLHLVIDTNILVSSLSSKSKYHWLVKLILEEMIFVHVSDEIILEYEEILSKKYNSEVAILFINALKELPNIIWHKIYFNWNLLKDEDDNKFVDCYVVSNAQYLITNDSDFNILKTVTFPQINVLKIDELQNLKNNL